VRTDRRDTEPSALGGRAVNPDMYFCNKYFHSKKNICGSVGSVSRPGHPLLPGSDGRIAASPRGVLCQCARHRAQQRALIARPEQPPGPPRLYPAQQSSEFSSPRPRRAARGPGRSTDHSINRNIHRFASRSLRLQPSQMTAMAAGSRGAANGR
jgi:hypothetical protein